MSKFQLDDWVWYATTEYRETLITCPDCIGTRHLTVIMGDGERLTIDCSLCSAGYDPPRGVIKVGDYAPAVRRAVIEGVERSSENIFEYRLNDCYRKPEKDLFGTKEEAEDRATVLAQELIDAGKDKIKRREKDTRSWAWNARYHRENIRRAEKDLLYHKAKLSVAALRAKGLDPETVPACIEQASAGQPTHQAKTCGGGTSIE